LWRAYLDVLTDDVVLWAIPGSKLDLYAERRSARAIERRYDNLPPGAPQGRGGWQEPDEQGIVGGDGEPEQV